VGTVHIFSTAGALLNTVTNPTPQDNDNFGQALAGLGNDRVAIGAPGDNTVLANSGMTYIYSISGTLLHSITNPTPGNDDQFGDAVAIVGNNRIAVGVPSDGAGDGGDNSGVVQLFTTNGAFLLTITNPSPAVNDYFGYSVAAVGVDKLVVGAHQDDTSGLNAGIAYLFSINGALLATYTNPTPSSPENDAFGSAVAGVGNDKVLIGSPGMNATPGRQGAAFLFDLSGNLLRTLQPVWVESLSLFGSSVAGVGSEMVLIGGPQQIVPGLHTAGGAVLMDLNGNVLTALSPPALDSGDYFGTSVAPVGLNTLVVGASRKDTAFSNNGEAYVFNVGLYNPGVISETVRPGGVGTTALADGSVTPEKLAAGSFNFTGSGNSFVGTFTGAGDGLTNLNASALNLGTTPDARLSANVALLNATNVFTATQAITGGALGLGTTNPQAPLHVHTPIGEPSSVRFSSGGSWPLSLVQTPPSVMVITNGGAGRIFMNSSGDVGIGNTIPLHRLHVGTYGTLSTINDASQTTVVENTNANGRAAYLAVAGPGAAAVATNRVEVALEADEGQRVGLLGTMSDHPLQVRVGNTTRMFVSTNGNIGLGTTNPQAPLHVHTAIGEPSSVRFSSGGSWPLSLVQTPPSVMVITNGGAARIFMNSSGDVGIGNTIPLHRLHVGTYGTLPTINDASQRTVVENTNANGRAAYLAVAGPGAAAVATNRVEVALEADEGQRVGLLGTMSDHPLQVRVGNTTRMFVSTNGNVGLGTNNPAETLHVVGNILATGTITPSSDRNLKKNFAAVDPLAVLEKLNSLSIQQWTYKAEQDAVHHVGPMAQDFHAAFGLGADDVTIATVDADGVALAAIQGLNQKLTDELRQKQTEITALEQRLEKLEQLVNRKLGGGAQSTP
jgi:hypothetical protein